LTGENGGACFPGGNLIVDSAGNIYGTGEAGGLYGYGAVFKLTPKGRETILYSFTRGADGGQPDGLIAGPNGDLYGTTVEAGNLSCERSIFGCGVVYKLTPGGTETVLHSFSGKDGAFPACCLIADSSGHLYGTTGNGGGPSDGGVVFTVKE
jgi:uncharacterized repeat protein (TIGR03803 family)